MHPTVRRTRAPNGQTPVLYRRGSGAIRRLWASLACQSRFDAAGWGCFFTGAPDATTLVGRSLPSSTTYCVTFEETRVALAAATPTGALAPTYGAPSARDCRSSGFRPTAQSSTQWSTFGATSKRTAWPIMRGVNSTRFTNTRYRKQPRRVPTIPTLLVRSCFTLPIDWNQ